MTGTCSGYLHDQPRFRESSRSLHGCDRLRNAVAAASPKPKPAKAEASRPRRRSREETDADKAPAARRRRPRIRPWRRSWQPSRPRPPNASGRRRFWPTSDRPDLAKGFLKKVLDAKLDPQQLADLGEQFGSPMFLDMAGRAALLPEAKQLADAVAAAVKARLEDAKRIAGLIRQLQDPSPEKRDSGDGRACRRRARRPSGRCSRCWPIRPAPPNMPTSGRRWPAWAGRPASRWSAVLERADPKLAVQAILVLGEMNDPKVAICSARPVSVGEERSGGARAAAATALKRLSGAVPPGRGGSAA